jgi:putative glutamine amidotransferase
MKPRYWILLVVVLAAAAAAMITGLESEAVVSSTPVPSALLPASAQAPSEIPAAPSASPFTPPVPAPRYLDTAPDRSDAVRLLILDPAEEGINAVLGLRRQGLLPIDNLVLVGLYHEKERANYVKAMEYVRANGLDWIEFHELSGEIDASSLFEPNALTADFAAAFRKTDGAVFFGGNDIPPAVYGRPTSILTKIVTPYRHYLEISLAFHLLGGPQAGPSSPAPFLDARPGYPVLGICLGSQTLNVGAGGTLYQDIWSEVYGAKTVEEVIAIGSDNWHKNPYPLLFPGRGLYSVNMHPIRLLAEGKFVRDFGFPASATPIVRCGHHQALEVIGRGLKVIATSMDGRVVEGFEHIKYSNVLGVAFHPEDPRLWDASLKGRFAPDDPDETSWLAVLQKNPPSYAFHAKIWAWLTRALLDSHANSFR